MIRGNQASRHLESYLSLLQRAQKASEKLARKRSPLWEQEVRRLTAVRLDNLIGTIESLRDRAAEGHPQLPPGSEEED